MNPTLIEKFSLNAMHVVPPGGNDRFDLPDDGLARSRDEAGSGSVDSTNADLTSLVGGKFSIDEVVQTLTNALHNLDLTKNAQEHLPDEGVDFNDAVRSYKISLIKCALRKCRGKQNHAAKLLRLKHTTLNTIIKKYEIDI